MSTLTLYTVVCRREDGKTGHTMTTSDVVAAQDQYASHEKRGCPVRLIEGVHENDTFQEARK